MDKMTIERLSTTTRYIILRVVLAFVGSSALLGLIVWFIEKSVLASHLAATVAK